MVIPFDAENAEPQDTKFFIFSKQISAIISVRTSEKPFFKLFLINLFWLMSYPFKRTLENNTRLL